MLTITTVSDVNELQQIHQLNLENLKSNVSLLEQQQEGFVTWAYPLDLLEKMHELAPSVIIKDKNTVVGYPVINRFKGVSAQELADNSIQDTRSILYWNTTLQPEKGKETIQFYNNDISDKLRMIVIGFTKDGTPVYLNQEVSL